MPESTPPLESRQSEVRHPEAAKGTNGKHLIHVEDPQGYEVVLEVETWDSHIIKQHPEIEKFFDLIGKTLSEPQLIQQSRRQGETYYYYRLTGRSFYRINDIYLSVVVRRDDDAKKGVVKTVHLLKEVRKDGETVWMKRN